MTHKAATDAIAKVKAGSEASGHVDTSSVTEGFLDRMVSFVSEVSKASEEEVLIAQTQLLTELQEDTETVFGMIETFDFKDEEIFMKNMTEKGSQEIKRLADLQVKLEKCIKKTETMYGSAPEGFKTAQPYYYLQGIPKFRHIA